MGVKFVILIFSIFLFHNAVAQYFVSPAGNDQAKGSINQPFKTIQRAVNIMKPGDTCFIREGVYRETIRIQTSGTAAKPVVITAFKNEKVVITGTDVLVNWQEYAPNIYYSVTKIPILQLSVNGKHGREACYPDINPDNYFDSSSWLQVETFPDGTAKFLTKEFPENYWKGAKIIAVCYFRWVSLYGDIDYSNKDSMHCQIRSDKWNQGGYRKYIGEGVGYITAHIHTLDSENEWLWKDDTLFVFSLTDIRQKTVEAQYRPLAVQAQGKSFIVLKNIDFTYSSIDFGAAGNCLIENCRFSNICPFFTNFESFHRFLKSKDDTLNYGISHWPGKGLKISGSNNIIRNCSISGSWGDGISLGGNNNRIENCLIEDCCRSATDAAGIAMIGRKHTVIRCTIRNCGRSGIVHNDCRDIKILYNDIYYCGRLTCDNGMPYCFRTNGGKTEIAYNWLHDNKAVMLGEGVYTDNHSSGVYIHHNVIWNCAAGIRTNKPAENIFIYHNTVFDCPLTQATTGYIDFTSIKNMPVFNNLSDKIWSEGTELSHNFNYYDFRKNQHAKYKFLLPEQSPAIDYGIVWEGLTLSFKGKAPDAGAYEFGEEIWIPGSNLVD